MCQGTQRKIDGGGHAELQIRHTQRADESNPQATALEPMTHEQDLKCDVIMHDCSTTIVNTHTQRSQGLHKQQFAQLPPVSMFCLRNAMLLTSMRPMLLRYAQRVKPHKGPS